MFAAGEGGIDVLARFVCDDQLALVHRLEAVDVALRRKLITLEQMARERPEPAAADFGLTTEAKPDIRPQWMRGKPCPDEVASKPFLISLAIACAIGTAAYLRSSGQTWVQTAATTTVVVPFVFLAGIAIAPLVVFLKAVICARAPRATAPQSRSIPRPSDHPEPSPLPAKSSLESEINPLGNPLCQHNLASFLSRALSAMPYRRDALRRIARVLYLSRRLVMRYFWTSIDVRLIERFGALRLAAPCRFHGGSSGRSAGAQGVVVRFYVLAFALMLGACSQREEDSSNPVSIFLDCKGDQIDQISKSRTPISYLIDAQQGRTALHYFSERDQYFVSPCEDRGMQCLLSVEEDSINETGIRNGSDGKLLFMKRTLINRRTGMMQITMTSELGENPVFEGTCQRGVPPKVQEQKF